MFLFGFTKHSNIFEKSCCISRLLLTSIFIIRLVYNHLLFSTGNYKQPIHYLLIIILKHRNYQFELLLKVSLLSMSVSDAHTSIALHCTGEVIPLVEVFISSLVLLQKITCFAKCYLERKEQHKTLRFVNTNFAIKSWLKTVSSSSRCLLAEVPCLALFSPVTYPCKLSVMTYLLQDGGEKVWWSQ